MIVFELTMPNTNTWNGRWSGENKRFIKIMPNKMVPKELVGKSYGYDFRDGWYANISVEKYPTAEARKLMKQSAGFMGYGWMIDSILKRGEIVYERKQVR